MRSTRRHRDKTTCLLQWQRAGLRGRLRISKGPRWPQQAAAPSLQSCVASSGRASSSQTCLLAMTASPTPMEFLQLYELSIKAANNDEKVMANWFPMALKDGARLIRLQRIYFPNTFALVLDSHLHDLNETNPD